MASKKDYSLELDITFGIKEHGVVGTIKRRLNSHLKHTPYYGAVTLQHAGNDRLSVYVRGNNTEKIEKVIKEFIDSCDTRYKVRIQEVPKETEANKIETKCKREIKDLQSRLEEKQKEIDKLRSDNQDIPTSVSDAISKYTEVEKLNQELRRKLSEKSEEALILEGLIGEKFTDSEVYALGTREIGQLIIYAVKKSVQPSLERIVSNIEGVVSSLSDKGIIFQDLKELMNVMVTPFEQTEDYCIGINDYESALDSITKSKALAGDRFLVVDTSKAQEVIKGFEETRQAYQTKREAVIKIKDSFAKQNIQSFLITEEKQDAFKISIVLPIDYKENPTALKALEQEILRYASTEVQEIIKANHLSLQRGDRLGLYELSCDLNKSEFSADRVEGISQDIRSELIGSQARYNFFKIGVRMQPVSINLISYQEQINGYIHKEVSRPSRSLIISRKSSRKPSIVKSFRKPSTSGLLITQEQYSSLVSQAREFGFSEEVESILGHHSRENVARAAALYLVLAREPCNRGVMLKRIENLAPYLGKYKTGGQNNVDRIARTFKDRGLIRYEEKFRMYSLKK